MAFWHKECGKCGYRVKFCVCMGRRASGRVEKGQVGSRTTRSTESHEAKCRRQGYRPIGKF